MNGIGTTSGKKRRKLFNYLHTLKADIFLLQETHSKIEDEKLWKAEWGNEILFNHGLSNARGTMMLFTKRFCPNLDNVYKDNEGRILILKTKLNDCDLAVANVYAPNLDKV